MAKVSAVAKIIAKLKAEIDEHQREIEVKRKVMSHLEISLPFKKAKPKPRVVPDAEKAG